MASLTSSDAFLTYGFALVGAPFLDLRTLGVAVAVCRSWRTNSVKQVMARGGAQAWLVDSYREKLEEDSYKLCRLAASGSWLEQGQASLGLIVNGDANPLMRTLMLLQTLDSVPLPPPSSRFRFMEGDGTLGSDHMAEDRWIIVKRGLPNHAEEARIARELRLQWSAAASVGSEMGKFNESMWELCTDTIFRWRTLCSCVSCGSLDDCELGMQSFTATFKQQSATLHGTDCWKVDMLIIGNWELPLCLSDEYLGNARPSKEFGYVDDPLAAASFTYWVQD